MNSQLHHPVVTARLADLRRTAEIERIIPLAAPPPREASRRPSFRGLLRRRIVRPAS